MNKLVVRALRLLLPVALLFLALRLLGGGGGGSGSGSGSDSTDKDSKDRSGVDLGDGVEALPPGESDPAPFVRAPNRNKEEYQKVKEERLRRARKRHEQRDKDRAARDSQKAEPDWNPPGDPVLRARWKRRIMEDCAGVEDEDFLTVPDDAPPGPTLFNRLLLRTRCRYVRLHARLPPAGFDAWVTWADRHQCELDHYPAIERDLKPYRLRYRKRADLLRKVVGAMMEQEEHAKHYLRIRNGTVYTWGEGAEVTKVPIVKFAWALPDMDMIVNWLDEPRVLAWNEAHSEMTDAEAEELEERVAYAYNNSRIRMFHDDRSKSIPAPPNSTRFGATPTDEERAEWKAAADAANDPEAPADPFAPEPPYDPLKPIPFYDYSSKDIREVMREKCPPLRDHPAADRAMSLHGFFLAPTTFRPVYSLIPVFTATKPVLGSRGTIHDEDAVSCFQDIILPNHLSLRTKTPPGINPPPWAQRKNKMIWRGRSTGGQLTWESNWRDFQRPRAVEYSNRLMAKGDDRIDLQFTDIIQCDDGRGGRGGYFEKIDFDFQADGDEAALEELWNELKAEARGRAYERRKLEAEQKGEEYDPEIPGGKDDEEWERDKMALRIRGLLDKIQKDKTNKAAPAEGTAPPAEGAEGGDATPADGEEGIIEEGDGTAEEGDEEGGDEAAEGEEGEEEEEGAEEEEAPVIEEQNPKRRLRKRADEPVQKPVKQRGTTRGKGTKAKPKPPPPPPPPPPEAEEEEAAPAEKEEAPAADEVPAPAPAAKGEEEAANTEDEVAEGVAPAKKKSTEQRPIVGAFNPDAKVWVPKKNKKVAAALAAKKAAAKIGLSKKLHPLLLSNSTAGLKRTKKPAAVVKVPKKKLPPKPRKRVNMCALAKHYYGIGGWMSSSDCYNYKYLFDVDGNTWSQRFESFLWGGSLVFRMSLFSNWFDQYILPDVHYIHLNVTLSDLEAKLDWAMKHDAEAEAMAKRAQEVAQTRLRVTDMECYLYRLLLEYSQIGDETWLNDD